MQERKFSRREALKLFAAGAVGTIAAACQAEPEQVIITQEVVVKETVIVEGTPEVVEVEKIVTAAAPAKEPVNLRFNTSGWGGWLAEPWIEMVDRFNESQDGIIAEYQDVAEGTEKIVAEAAGGVAADLYVWWHPSMQQWASKGFFTPLDELVSISTVINKDDYYTDDWENMFWGGHMLNVPFDNSPATIWYNLDLFDEKGVDYPPRHFGEWTWQDFLATAEELTYGEGSDRVYGWGGEPWWIYQLCWVWSNGGLWLNEEHTECVISSPESREALQWGADLIHEYNVQPLPHQMVEGGTNAMFYTGRAAMAQKGTWWAIDLKGASEETGLRWDVAPMPDGVDGSFVRNPLDSFAIWQGSQKRDEAWQLLEFLNLPEILAIITRAGLSVSRIDVMNDVFLTQDPDWVNWGLFLEALDAHVHPQPITPIFATMNNNNRAAWEAVVGGDWTVDEFIDTVEAETNELLDECYSMGVCTPFGS